MTVAASPWRPRDTVVLVPLALAVTAGLALLAALTLGFAPPPRGLVWLVVWELLAGVGLAVAARQVLKIHKSSATGWWLLAAAVLLLIAGPLRGAGSDVAADASLAAAMSVAVPLAVFRVAAPSRARRVPWCVDVAAIVLGAAVTITVTVAPRAVVITAALGVGAAVIGAEWLRFELTAGDERRRVLWVIVGLCSFTTSAALFWFSSADDVAPTRDLVVTLVMAPVSLLLPLTVAIAVLAPRRFDVRAVIGRVTVVAVMATLTVAAFTGTEAAVTALSGRAPPAPARALLAAVIAAGFHPTLVRVRGVLEELLFGGRADTVATLTLLGTELSTGSPPQEWADTLRVALGVPSVVLTGRGRVLAASPAAAGSPDGDGGHRAGRVEVTALMAASEHVGDLAVGIPAEQLQLSPATRLVLTLIAAPVAQALQAMRLGEQLQASRGQVVAALEEERRRVRRDLHDGLGPTLTGIAYSAEAASNLVASDAERAGQLLRELRADTADAIAEIRRIVYGLRPRALDELGLVAAVRQRLTRSRAADGRLMSVEVVSTQELPELPAAVEVAAYRVAVEAVTNVARHAGVAAARVTFAVSDHRALVVAIADQGVSPGPWVPGVGIRAMRERAEEVGGQLTVTQGPSGSQVVANLPLDLAALP